MMFEDDERLPDYWSVYLPDNYTMRVAPEAVEAIKAALARRDEWIAFTTIEGSEVLYRSKLIEGLADKSVAIRDVSAAQVRAEKAEIRAARPPWESDDG
jgi:hypothetical protein